MQVRLRIATRTLVVVTWVLTLGLAGGPALAADAALTPAALLQLAQKSTFEVVLPKIEPEYVHYEKPLPLELLTFRERTDKFWSIGTAFAIAPDTYVSAAHVLLSGLGSAMGKPQLRDAEGHTYPVEQILKFSLHEDYIVFRAHGLTATQVLQPQREPATGSNVYAVGNALGDGVVMRDGLLTSLTPEDQDGRWKWLRFSAAASPGNSGGPLLDSSGHVLGVVTMKSPGENLNYALPIARVLDGTEAAMFDVRSSFSIPILRQQLVTEFKDRFALPAKWEDFARLLMERADHQYDGSLHRLLDEHAAELPPRGAAARLLATLDRQAGPGLMHEQSDDKWEISEPGNEEETKLAGGASLWMGSVPGAFSFRLERPAQSADSAVYHDDVAFMDTLLKGVKMPRTVGTQAIRITSLGAPQRRDQHKDRFGRIWQMRSWSVGFTDLELVTLTLPTPEGYAGIAQFTQAINFHDNLALLYLLADYTNAAYRGSPAQWKALLAERELCPPFLDGIRFTMGMPISVPLRGLDVAIPATLLPITNESRLDVFPIYAADGTTLRVGLGGVTLEAKPEKDSAWVGVWSQPHPVEDAGKELNDRWRKMNAHEGDFSGQPQHNTNFNSYWTTSVLGDASRGVVYEVTLSLENKSLLPRQVSERRDQLLAGLQLKKDAP